MKKCIKCQQDLNDDVMVCPFCKTPQNNNQQQSKIIAPQQSVMVKKSKKKIIVLLSIVLSAVLIGVIAYASVIISYQFKWSNYVNENIDNWVKSVKSAELTIDELNELEKDINKYDENKYTTFHVYEIGRKRCKNYDAYFALSMSDTTYDLLKKATLCHNEYLKWQKNPEYKVSQEADSTWPSLYSMKNSLAVVDVDGMVHKYIDWIDEMCPVKENVHIKLYRPTFDNPKVECTVSNENAFSIRGFCIQWDISILYVTSYSGVEFEYASIDIKDPFEIKGGESKDFEYGFNASDYHNSYHSYDYWDIKESKLTVVSVGADPADQLQYLKN